MQFLLHNCANKTNSYAQLSGKFCNSFCDSQSDTMLLSFSKGYLFIANQKVASESIHLVAGDDADLALVRIGHDKHCTHPALLKILGEYELKEEIESVFTFSIVREPAEWLISWYNSRARAPLANPAHKRHAVYTGNTSFDEFLDLAKGTSPHPMTKVKAQSSFFRSAQKFEVVPLAFSQINETFPKLFPHSSLANFQLGNKRQHKNKSKVRRVSSADLTTNQRRFINEELFAGDYALYRSALEMSPKLSPATPKAGQAERLRKKLSTEYRLKDLAFETAYGEAQTRLYRGENVAIVAADLQRYETIDIGAVIAAVESRVARFKNESDL